MNKFQVRNFIVTLIYIAVSIIPMIIIMPHISKKCETRVLEESSRFAMEQGSEDAEDISQAEIIYDDEVLSTKKYSLDDKLGDVSCFDNSAFIGNSHAEALKLYGLIPNADFYTQVGLSILGVFGNGGSSSYINKLYNKKYDKVFFMFGENELGWPYPENFAKEYEKIIDAAHEILPDADIYIQSIFPVSASASEKNHNGVTNKNVNTYNKLLKELADNKDKVYYMDVASAVEDENGCLPEDAAVDGMHFGPNYCRIWVNYLIDNIS